LIRPFTATCRLINRLRLLSTGRSECARRFATSVLGFCLACILSHTAIAQSGNEAVINREHTLKALFIYNFGSYVEWPPTTSTNDGRPFVIGILGSTPVESTLREIAVTKTINGRRIVIQRFASADAVKPCQILFIASNSSPQVQQQVVEKLQREPVLIVGESKGFALHGAVVNFYLEANKIRFEINVDAARRHHLTISSKLLALAKIVDSNGAASR